MSIRIRKVNGVTVALCGVESDPMLGDLWLSDDVHHALSTKFGLDWESMGFIKDPPIDPVVKAAMETQKVRDAREVYRDAAVLPMNWAESLEFNHRDKMNRALESDTEAQKVGIDDLIALLLLRHSSLLKITQDHPHREAIKQARDSAQAELRWRMLSTVGLLDWWDQHRQYVVGQSKAGDWMGFDAEQHTCYAPSTHECLSKLQIMHADLQAKGFVRNICTPENPMPKDAPGQWEHTNAEEVGDQENGYPGGDIVRMRCKDCGKTWKTELPQ